MIYFRSDYSLGAHPKIMQALMDTNMEHTDGYCLDRFSDDCTEMIRQWVGKPDADVYYFVGGTPCNTTTVSAGLRPYEGVITPATGHIYVHETGSIELNGHRQFGMPTPDGKLRVEDIEKALLHHEDEHTVIPKMVYITHPTENGGVYTKAEMQALSDCCRKHNLTFYVDGARLGYGLSSKGCDVSLNDLARLADVFYIGGTKQGALFGEAVVITNPALKKDFRYFIKQNGGMLAKGRLLGIQFMTLFEDGLYFELAQHAVAQAMRIKDAFEAKGYSFLVESPSNQQFPILPNAVMEALSADFRFSVWKKVDQEHTAVRFCTSWATDEKAVDALISAVSAL